MEKFLDQFKLSPLHRIAMASFIFSLADDMVKGYGGGFWNDDHFDSLVFLRIPSNTGPITLHIEASGNTIETDSLTASAAFTFIAVIWYWNIQSENLSHETNEAFSEWYFAFRDAVYDSNLVNTNDFHTFTD